jgi:hypothetical protein
VGSALVANLNTQYLNSQAGTYYLDCANFTGTLANARVQQSNVTQHEAALSIAAGSQLTGTLADGTVAQSNVTQHEGALVLAYTQLSFSGLTIGHVWRATSATTAGFGTISNAGFADNTIAHARLVNISQNQVLGRTAVGGGAVSAIATSALTGLAAGGITSGTFVDARIAASNVTQHEAALSIGAGQITGTLAKARLPSATAYEDEANTFTLTQAFNHATTAFTLTDTSVITNLNADRVDGNHASAFATASHAHDTADVTTGTFVNARISESSVTQHGSAVFSARDVADIGDVTITAIGAGELLKWSGTAWINNTLAEAGIPTLPINASDVSAGTFADDATYTFQNRLDVANGNVAIGIGDKANIHIDGVDGAIAAGGVGIFEAGGSLGISSRWGVVVYLDNDNNGTGNKFGVRANVASGGSDVFSVDENGNTTIDGAVAHTIHMDSTGNDAHTLSADSNRTTADSAILNLTGQWNGDDVSRILLTSGNDTTNKDDGKIAFQTQPDNATGLQTRMWILQNGQIEIIDGRFTVLAGTAAQTTEVCRFGHVGSPAAGNPILLGKMDASDRFLWQMWDGTTASPGFYLDHANDKIHILDLTEINYGTDEHLRINHSSATGSPLISFQQNGTQRSFIQHSDSGDTLIIASEYGDISFRTHTAGSEVQALRVGDDRRVYLDDGSTNEAEVAGVVVSTSAASGDYPEGTIWARV